MTAIAGLALWVSGESIFAGIDVYPESERSSDMGGLRTLTLELINEPVTIRRGSGSEAEIEWSQRYDGQYKLTQTSGGIWKLSRDRFFGNYRWNRGWFRIDLDWLAGWTKVHSDIEDGSHRPVTVTIPGDMDLRRININGIDLRVTIENIDAERIDIDGVNAQVAFFHDDITTYNYETRGFGSTLRIDGKTQGSVGHNSGAARSVTVNGANAELNVWTNE
jgi:hypothetical protein